MEVHMKILVPLALFSALLVSACASSPNNKETSRTPAATPQMSSAHSYQCKSGETIVATYPSTDSATVQYKGSSYNMKIAVSGSGSRYIGGELEWWTKGSGAGSTGTLMRHNSDGTSGESIELCTES